MDSGCTSAIVANALCVKGYHTEEYPSHTHDAYEHSNTANDHPHPRDGHDHHVQPNLQGEFGPDLRSHGGVEHVHRCFDLKPSCNKDDYSSTPGLPIEVTHSHGADSEPGHGFDWEEWFAGRGPDATGAAVAVADAEAVGGEDAHLRFEVTLEPTQAFAVRMGLRDGRRHGDGRRGLHGDQRGAGDPARRDQRDGAGAGKGPGVG